MRSRYVSRRRQVDYFFRFSHQILNIKPYSENQKLTRAFGTTPTTTSPNHFPADAGSHEINPLLAMSAQEKSKSNSKLFNRSSILLTERDGVLAHGGGQGTITIIVTAKRRVGHCCCLGNTSGNTFQTIPRSTAFNTRKRRIQRKNQFSKQTTGSTNIDSHETSSICPCLGIRAQGHRLVCCRRCWVLECPMLSQIS